MNISGVRHRSRGGSSCTRKYVYVSVRRPLDLKEKTKRFFHCVSPPNISRLPANLGPDDLKEVPWQRKV